MRLIDIKIEICRRGYNIGFFDAKYLASTDKERNRKVRWLNMKGYRKGWFADPFFLDVDDDFYYILAEEFVYQTNRGRLVKLTISRKNTSLEKVEVILELDTHLSFPILIRENEEFFVYPENYQSGGVGLYRYNLQKNILEFQKRIIDEPLLDTQIVKIEGKYYAFGVRWETNTQDDTKQLRVFESESLRGPYTYIQTIKNNLKEERGAGKIYSKDGFIYRPAQSCEGGYGKAVILYRLFFNNGTFMEKEEKRLLPDANIKYGKVLHTLNIMNDVCVIDGYDYAHPKLVQFLRFFGLIKS